MSQISHGVLRSVRSIAPMEALARRLGCTHARAYTLTIGLFVATVGAISGVPPSLRDRVAIPNFAAPSALQPPTGESESSGSSTDPETAKPSIVVAVQPWTDPPAGGTATSGPVDGAPASPSHLAFGEMSLFARFRASGPPEGIAVADGGDVFVGSRAQGGGAAPSQVVRFSAVGAVKAVYEVLGQNLALSSAGLPVGLTGLVVDPDEPEHVYALDVSPARVLQIDFDSAEQRDYAVVPNLPRCAVAVLPALPTGACEPTLEDRAPLLTGAAFDIAGNLFVTDAAQATIWKIPAGGGAATVFHQSVDYASTTGLGGIEVEPDGALVFVASATLAPTTGNHGALYRLAVNGGVAGARSTITEIDAANEPVQVVSGASGQHYVTLRNSHEVLIIAADGTHKGVLATGADEGRGFANPVGIAFRGQSLLVTNQKKQEGDDYWAVVAVGVDDVREPGSG